MKYYALIDTAGKEIMLFTATSELLKEYKFRIRVYSLLPFAVVERYRVATVWVPNMITEKEK